MKYLLALVLLLFTIVESSKECIGEEMPASDRLRVGIKSRPETCSQKTKKGDELLVHYDGKFYKTCEIFDSTRSRGVPFQFTLGNSEVIEGWDQGLMSMCIGEVRKLSIPSHLGYSGGPSLVYEIELISISSTQE